MRTPPEQPVWDQQRLDALDAGARAARAEMQFAGDYIWARSQMQRAISDVSGAHKTCPLKRCRRSRACRAPQICVVLPLNSPSPRQQQIIEALYEQKQRVRRNQAMASKPPMASKPQPRKAGRGE